jgi:hypothetical protein
VSGPTRSLLSDTPRVLNLGLEVFAEELSRLGVPTVHVDWRPGPAADPSVAALVARLETRREAIAQANRNAWERLVEGQPVLVDCRPAHEALGLPGRTVLHAGPPIAWERMCEPMRAAITFAIRYEGWAANDDAARGLVERGAVPLAPCHDWMAVGPMTGIVTGSMPVFVVENRAHGMRAHATINEGLGKVLRFGGNDAEVLARLAWLRDVLGPAIGRALRTMGGIPLKPIVARGLTMGDEMHQRNVACSGLLLRQLAPALARTQTDPSTLADVLAFIGRNDQFFLNVAMAMGKALSDPARDVAMSSIVTAMCRNGTDFGIRVAGTGDQWFTAPVEMPQGLYFPGFSEADANPDMGDSAIVETIGLGGFAMAAAPAVVGFVGAGRASDAALYTRSMGEITWALNPDWTIPALDHAGVPTGIDVRRVVATGIAPTINTGIAHRMPGVGQVGAGIVKAPLACFELALSALAARIGVS